MQTPSKSRRKLQLTTAHTLRSGQQSRYNNTAVTHPQKILYTDYQTNLSVVKTKLHFNQSVEGTSRSRIVSLNQEAEQVSYRNRMKEQLDRKFASFMQKQPGGRVLNVPKKTAGLQQWLQKMRFSLKSLFREFWWNMKQHKIKELNQFYLGLILKNMNLINCILYDRKIVLSLFHEFSSPNIVNLFVFLVYTSLTAHQYTNQYQAQIKRQIQGLFLNQGIRINELHLKECFQEARQVAAKKQYQMLRVNRQNRPTFVSLSHQKANNHL